MSTCSVPPPGRMSFSFEWSSVGLDWEWLPPHWTCIYQDDAGRVVRVKRVDLQDVL